jgi:hypothetical protein
MSDAWIPAAVERQMDRDVDREWGDDEEGDQMDPELDDDEMERELYGQ